MFKIEYESVIDDFNALKKHAYQAYNKKKYEDVYCFISCAATLAYHLNFCYCDAIIYYNNVIIELNTIKEKMTLLNELNKELNTNNYKRKINKI